MLSSQALGEHIFPAVLTFEYQSQSKCETEGQEIKNAVQPPHKVGHLVTLDAAYFTVRSHQK